jgi:hypothetical protein
VKSLSRLVATIERRDDIGEIRIGRDIATVAPPLLSARTHRTASVVDISPATRQHHLGLRRAGCRHRMASSLRHCRGEAMFFHSRNDAA